MPARNTEDLNTASTTILTGLLIETPGIATLNALQNPSNEPDTTDTQETDGSGGLPVETWNPTTQRNVDEPKKNLELETQNRLHVEMETANETGIENGNSPQVKTQDKREPKQPEKENQINDAAIGLIMLGQERTKSLFDKYDNSKLLPVDAARQVDFGQDPNAEEAVLNITENETQIKDSISTDKMNEDENSNYDSDDTIILEKEISDAIGENPMSKVEPDTLLMPENGLIGETAETSNVTNQLANLMMNIQPKSADKTNKDGLPAETADTLVSPSKGKMVIRSYRLRHTVPNDTEKTKTATSEQDNTENEVLHLKVPSGNAMRPPPPNKYKIHKFQIDNIRYYSCMYCSKHFESIHDLNKHHKSTTPWSLAMCVIDSTTPQIH